jgi:hypothetical protein
LPTPPLARPWARATPVPPPPPQLLQEVTGARDALEGIQVPLTTRGTFDHWVDLSRHV